MKHLTIHESRAALNAIKAQLAKPQVAYVNEDNSIYYENYVPNVTPVTPVTPSHDYSQDYFTLEAIDDCDFNYYCADGGIQYSIDGGETWSEEWGESTISILSGEKVLLKGNMTLGTKGYSGTNLFSSTGRYNVEGNIFSLYYGDNFTDVIDISDYDSCFGQFFNGDIYIVNAEHLSLPATTLASSCYNYMFAGCTSLTTAPSILPATTLAYGCYAYMFQGCTSLTTAPELPATTLATVCYEHMFQTCTSLTTAPELPATTLSRDCYYQMFQGCTSLTTAPELPATTLADSCYGYMFSGCTSLNYVKCLATDKSAISCTHYWLENIASTGTFVKAASTSWTTGEDGIPSGWTVQDAA